MIIQKYTTFDLDAFIARRDAVLNGNSWEHWNATAEEIIAAYRAGERFFWRVYVRSSHELDQPNFTGADLRGAIFSDSIMRDVTFAGANLDRCDFYNTDLRGSRLGKNLRDANLRNADLRNVVISGDLTEANLDHANLRDGRIDGAILHNASARSADMMGILIMNSDFSGIYMRGAKLNRTTISDVNFSDADLSDVDMSDITIESANFDGATVTGVSFTDKSYLYQATIPYHFNWDYLPLVGHILRIHAGNDIRKRVVARYIGHERHNARWQYWLSEDSEVYQLLGADLIPWMIEVLSEYVADSHVAHPNLKSLIKSQISGEGNGQDH